MNYKLDGFKVIDIFNQSEIELILHTIFKQIKISIIESIDQHDLNFLYKYEKQNLHDLIVSSPKRYINLPQIIIRKIESNKQLNQLWTDYSNQKYMIFWTGNIKNKLFEKNAAGFRLVRPNKKNDVAPPHTDKHIGGIYRESNIRFLSLWVPLNEIGCKESLALARSSHNKSHPKSELTESNGKLSICYKESYFNKFKIVRPRLQLGQGIVFDGNILHGGAYNSLNSTRVSIEIRFYPKNLIESLYK
jgi:hypothetical protein